MIWEYLSTVYTPFPPHECNEKKQLTGTDINDLGAPRVTYYSTTELAVCNAEQHARSLTK